MFELRAVIKLPHKAHLKETNARCCFCECSDVVVSLCKLRDVIDFNYCIVYVCHCVQCVCVSHSVFWTVYAFCCGVNFYLKFKLVEAFQKKKVEYKHINTLCLKKGVSHQRLTERFYLFSPDFVVLSIFFFDYQHPFFLCH